MKEIFDLTKKLISVPSLDSNPLKTRECFDILEKEFSNFFIIKKNTFRGRPTMILSNTKEKNLDLIIAGHLDVVSGPKRLFNALDKDGRLYGRGAFDMKGPLAASIIAVKHYLDRARDAAKIAIFITADEEIDGLSTEYLVKNFGFKANFSILPDGGGETKIVTHQKGFLQLEIIINGKSAHASAPWIGDNPIEKGIFFYEELKKEFPCPKTNKQWETSVVLTKITAGKNLNQIPDEARFYLDIRYVDEHDIDKICKLAQEKSNSGLRLNIVAHNGMLASDRTNPFLKKLRSSIKKITGTNAILSKESSTSDAVFLAQNNIPAVLFSPEGGGAHQNDEWIDKKSLVKFHDVLMDFFEGFNK